MYVDYDEQAKIEMSNFVLEKVIPQFLHRFHSKIRMAM